jgi:hypothetical protein
MADRSVAYPFIAGVESRKSVRLVGSLAPTEPASRRPVYGGVGSLSGGMDPLRQPQDGALRARAESPRVASIEAYLPGGSLLEPEDARLTGSTRSLRRRLLGLNVAAAALTSTLDTIRNAPLVAAKAASSVVPKPTHRAKVA